MLPAENRGNYLPPGFHRLAAYGGFYINKCAVYQNGQSTDAEWEQFEQRIAAKLRDSDNAWQSRFAWKKSRFGPSRYTIAAQPNAEIIAEEQDWYIAVYAIIPENCPCPHLAKLEFQHHVKTLKQTLASLFPGSVYKRTGAWETEPAG